MMMVGLLLVATACSAETTDTTTDRSTIPDPWPVTCTVAQDIHSADAALDVVIDDVGAPNSLAKSVLRRTEGFATYRISVGKAYGEALVIDKMGDPWASALVEHVRDRADFVLEVDSEDGSVIVGEPGRQGQPVGPLFDRCETVYQP